MKAIALLGILAFAIAICIAWLVVKRAQKTRKPEDKDALRVRYFEAGLQYYVLARFAAITGFLPVSGNLFHHAVEMFLKGHLCKRLDVRERIRLGHGLVRTWRRYKKEVSDSALDQFDALISSLDKFERIRYPERVVERGMMGTISFKRVAVAASQGRPNYPAYEIVVDELDVLIKLIFERSKVNPLFFAHSLKGDASEYLKRWNEAGMF